MSESSKPDWLIILAAIAGLILAVAALWVMKEQFGSNADDLPDEDAFYRVPEVNLGDEVSE
jgi:hypothetical protein